ncbi:MAG: four helix bundle protein [Verrucomicrobiales bacterium]|jgi:four helix bundle protein
MAYQSFEDLEVWKRGCQQAVDVIHKLAECRNFSLRDQMGRCSISVPSNIAEGHERDSFGDFIRFLRIAKGSNGELRTQIYIAKKLGILAEGVTEMVQENKEISSMLQGLVRSL